MADLSSFGGMDEENAEIKRLNAEVVSLIACPVHPLQLQPHRAPDG